MPTLIGGTEHWEFDSAQLVAFLGDGTPQLAPAGSPVSVRGESGTEVIARSIITEQPITLQVVGNLGFVTNFLAPARRVNLIAGAVSIRRHTLEATDRLLDAQAAAAAASASATSAQAAANSAALVASTSIYANLAAAQAAAVSLPTGRFVVVTG